jgi:hypothetical protein
MNRIRTGRILLTLAALVTIAGTVGPDLLTETHAFNPAWTPHARFHTALSALTPAGNCLIALWLLWRRELSVPRAGLAAILIGFYWAIFPLCLLIPGTGLMFPAVEWPTVLAPLVLCAAGYALVRRGCRTGST